MNGLGVEDAGWSSFRSLLVGTEEAPAVREGSIGDNRLACLPSRTARDFSEPVVSDLARYRLRERDKDPLAAHGCGWSISSSKDLV